MKGLLTADFLVDPAAGVDAITTWTARNVPLNLSQSQKPHLKGESSVGTSTHSIAEPANPIGGREVNLRVTGRERCRDSCNLRSSRHVWFTIADIVFPLTVRLLLRRLLPIPLQWQPASPFSTLLPKGCCHCTRQSTAWLLASPSQKWLRSSSEVSFSSHK